MSASDVIPPQAGLDVKSVVKRFGGFTAVDDVSLSIKQGELISLLGPSGCGKTTILRMLGGLEFPDSGTIVVAGRNIEQLPPYERDIGFVFQRYALFPHMTVAANVAYPLKKRGIRTNELREKTKAALDLVGLSGFDDRKPSTLSGGQQQRVALARAIVFEPKLLLLDEPLAALDKQLRERMQFEVRRIQRRLGITTLFVTHDQTEAMAISDRIAVMRNGRVEQFGTAAELYEKPATEFVASFVGDSNLIDCELTDVADGHLATLINGTMVHVAKADFAGAGKLLLRPERIKLLSNDDDVKADNLVRGRVAEVAYLGNSIQMVANCSGLSLTMQIPNSENRPSIESGQEITLGWGRGDCVAIPRHASAADASVQLDRGNRP
jgi:spermidine/putrescine ABC transporter ATP-binding subunit